VKRPSWGGAYALDHSQKCRVLPACCLLVAGFAAQSLPGQSSEEQLHYLIQPDTFEQPSGKEQAAITAAICDGKSQDGHCDTCPGGSSVPDATGVAFSLGRVILGHFLAPNSTDAFATISGCEQMHASIGWGFLLTWRAGNWEKLEEALGVELGHCHAMRFHSGRQLLVCEDYRMEQFNLTHSVTAVFAKGQSIGFRNLLSATDTTRYCYPQDRLQKAQIDKIEFRELNGDGLDDISFTASLGTLRDSERRQELCQNAEAGKPGAKRPEPKVMKTYRIEYRFDGQRFTLTKDSQAAAKLFHWEN
jgi:hypothetical protein